MKYLITGANGFVGRELCRRLIEAGDTVTTLDNCRYEASRLGAWEAKGLRFCQGDIRKPADVLSAVQTAQPDAIIHLAALHYIPECENDAVLAAETNIVGTINLLNACPAGCHFVCTSSGAVYAPSDEPHREDSSLIGPSDVYGYTKLHAEQFTAYYAAKRGFPATIVRLFNVVGEGETSPHLIPEIMAQLRSGMKTLRLGTLSTRRDYIDVRDVAEGFHRLAKKFEAKQSAVQISNLGTGVMHSGDEVMEMIRAASGIPFKVETDPARVRPVDRPNLAADTTKLRARVGWVPSTPLAECLRRTWREPLLPRSLLVKYQLS